jgi:hypothetical protein
MVARHLRARSLSAPAVPSGGHLDEDALSAFIEGRLGETEAAPFVKHLVACSSCRRITAQLVRLDTEIAHGQPDPSPAVEEPGRIRRFLESMAARVFPSTEEDAVFAYHAPADDFKPRDETQGGSASGPKSEQD